MIKQHKVVLQNSLPAFIFAIDELRQEGWEFDPEMLPTTYGFSYEAGMVREITSEQLEQEQVEANKPSRAEILAKARAAKAARKSANG